jgi:hypothetical protein
MGRRRFLLFACIVEIIFGLGFLLIPEWTLAPVGVALTAGGVIMTRALGAAILGLAWAYAYARGTMEEAGVLAIMDAGVIYSALSGIAFLVGVLSSALSFSAGLSAVGLHAVLTAGLLYFGRFAKP